MGSSVCSTRPSTVAHFAKRVSAMTWRHAPLLTPSQSSRSIKTGLSPSSDQTGSGNAVGSTTLKREILGIALLLFAIFLAAAFGALALAQIRHGVSVQQSVGAVGNLLTRPLVLLVGWPAAILIPLVPAVHALRLFGRLESRTDRSWIIFFAGLVVLLPIALALIMPAPQPGLSRG